MKTLDSLFRLLWSYPPWAKGVVCANLVLILAVAILAPRATTPPPPGPRDQGQSSLGSREQGQPSPGPREQSHTYQLRIERVELFPPSPAAVVQVTATVNGTRFRYPSSAGVEWLEVSPSMAGQTFHLPTARAYTIQFELLKRPSADSPPDQQARLVSVDAVSFSGGSKEGRFPLHGFDPISRTRSGRIDAEIVYSLGPAE